MLWKIAKTTFGVWLLAFVCSVAAADQGEPGALETTLAELLLLESPTSHDSPLSRSLGLVLKHDFAYSPAIERLVEQALARSAERNSTDGSVWLPWHALILTGSMARAPSAGVDTSVSFDIPLADHPLVERYVDHFSKKGKWFFERWLRRAARYMPMMRSMLADAGLPEDCVFLAMVESGFYSQAYSRAAAVGFWQFTASTGRMYKLRQDAWVDERRDFVRSTEAAIAYLTHLHDEFQDWHLVWAAYNAGGGRVRRALRRYGEKDFWRLISHRNSLAKETQHHVPKIIAAAIVTKNHKKYGIERLPAAETLIFDEVVVQNAVELRKLASALAVPVQVLRELNPALLYDVTPPRKAYTLRVPPGLGEQSQQWLAASAPEQHVSYRRHKVKRGDTLWRIAQRHGSSIDAIVDFNGINRRSVLRPGQRLIIPSLKRQKKPRLADRRTSRAPRAPRHVASRVYRVSAGDTLWSIAKRHRVSVGELKRWNRRSSNHIRIGELLKISAPAARTARAKPTG